MSPLSPSATAVEDRPLQLRQRPDLTIVPAVYQGEPSWIIKDPVSLKYHRLREAEMLVLQMLQGDTSLRRIQARLRSRFPTQRVGLAELQHLIGHLYQAGMLISAAAGQGRQLLRRRGELRRRAWWDRLTNLLAIRFPGFDPEPLLRRLQPYGQWMFQVQGLLVWWLLALGAVGLLLSQWAEFQTRLPAFHDFFAARNVLWLALVMGVTKICHELGHGLACKHFGGECHEIGVMLLVFTPAMYCDTSDSWLLPNKWHRVWIGAAGIYVEILLASLATFAWWYSQPGLPHYLALNVMFVCSVSTVVFNANPLLRYDGYYMLADALEIPNLAEKSRVAMLNLLRVHALGLPPMRGRALPPRRQLLFAGYSLASFAYRWLVLVMIAMFVSRVFAPYGLQALGHGVLAISALGLLGRPLWQLGQFFAVPGRWQELQPRRLAVTLALLLLLLGGLALVPFPRHVWARVVVQPDGGEQVYVTLPGTLDRLHVRPGQRVAAGSLLAELGNSEIALRLLRMEGEAARYRRHLHHLRRRQADHPEAGTQIPAAQTALAEIEHQLAQLRADAQGLQLTARQAGLVIPPPERPATPESQPPQPLPEWQGSPLDPKNSGAWLERGALFCTVVAPDSMQAILIFDQTDLAWVAVGQDVDLRLEAYPGHRLRGTIREVARGAWPASGQQAAAAGGPDASAGRDAHLPASAGSVAYSASVPLRDLPLPLAVLPGQRGAARIRTGWEPILPRLIRFTQNTLRFR